MRLRAARSCEENSEKGIRYIMTNHELEKIANEVRKSIITALHSAKAGHPGGSLSAADIFTYLYFEEMNVDPNSARQLLWRARIYRLRG